jgi:ribose-phosphate pyrophosphokinase
MGKANTIAEHLEVDIVYASKKRDISTGRIIETTLPEDVDFTGAKVLIPDDIGDGMYTFIKLAEKLKERGAAQVDLYVTHLIGAKGLKCLQPHIDKLYCYQTVANYVNKQNVLDYNLGNYVK